MTLLGNSTIHTCTYLQLYSGGAYLQLYSGGGKHQTLIITSPFSYNIKDTLSAKAMTLSTANMHSIYTYASYDDWQDGT